MESAQPVVNTFSKPAVASPSTSPTSRQYSLFRGNGTIMSCKSVVFTGTDSHNLRQFGPIGSSSNSVLHFPKKVLSSTFANFRNSLYYRKLQTIPLLFMHFPNSQIHKELGHGPDAGYPKMAKVELSS